MTSSRSRLARTLASRRRLAAFAAGALLLLGALVPLTLAGAPNPSGPGVPVAVVNNHGVVLEPLEGLVHGTTYDLTFTNLTLAANGTVTGWNLRDPAGAQVGAPHALYENPQGGYNVTFPSAHLSGAGTWSLRDGNGTTQVLFKVQQGAALGVTFSSNPMTHAEDEVSFTITVSPLADGETARLSGHGVPNGTVVIGPSGQYVYFGPSPPVGDHVYAASVDANGDGQADRAGSGTLSVVAADAGYVTVSPQQIYQDEVSTLTIRTWTANGTPDGGRVVRVCGGPIGGGCTGNATTDANGTALVGVFPHEEGTLAVHRDDLATNATVQVSTRPTPATPTLRIGNVSGSSLLPVRASIFLDDVTDFGAVTATLLYDPSVVEVTNVTPGTIPGSSVTWNAENGTLTVLLTTDQVPGPSGSFAFANLTLRAVGSAGATSALDLEVVEAVRSNGTAFALAAVDGHFRAGLLGDVNGDDLIDALDHAALADHVVGKPPAGQVVLGNADLNRDGRVTGVDALFLRQHLAGKRPTF